MTYLAARMSRWGVGDYWEDVDQYARNHLAELQLTRTAAIQEIIDRHAPALDTIELEDWCQGVDTDDVLHRCRGIFMSDATSPTLIPLRPEHIPNRSRMQWVVCCTGNCTKALHEVFDAITDFDPRTQTARVNLLLNRAAPWLDVNSYLPYEGRAVIKNKQARRLLVRVPRWADKQAVRCTVDGELVRCAWVGNYALLVDLDPTALVSVEFPMVETTETYTLAWQEGEFWQESTKPPHAWDWDTLGPKKYKIHLRGNTVLDIEPRDTQVGIPLYTDRDPEKLRGPAPLHEVNRFVAGVTP